MSVAGSHPTELRWARFLAGELGWLGSWCLHRHLVACAACRKLESEMTAERQAFDKDRRRLDELARLAARPDDPAPRAVPIRGPRLAWALAAGLTMALAMVWSRTWTPETSLTAKGGDAFVVHVDRPAGPGTLGARCSAGDRLMARYRTARPYLLILERDGLGRIQVLHPRDGAASIRVGSAAGETPTSWVLDDAPGRECFAAFFSDVAVDAAQAGEVLAASPVAPEMDGVIISVRCCDKGDGP